MDSKDEISIACSSATGACSSATGRRRFLCQLAVLTATCAAAVEDVFAGGARFLFSQPRSNPAAIVALPIKYPGAGATLEGFLCHPCGGGPFPAVIVMHDGRGLDDYFRSVARRIAAKGNVVLAVDRLSRRGGTASFATPAALSRALESIGRDDTLRDLVAANRYLRSCPAVIPGRVIVTG